MTRKLTQTQTLLSPERIANEKLNGAPSDRLDSKVGKRDKMQKYFLVILVLTFANTWLPIRGETIDDGLACDELGKENAAKIGDLQFAEMCKQTDIRRLHVPKSNVSDAGLGSVKPLSQLRFLTLTDCRITDNGLVYLRELANLRGLQIEGNSITDVGLKHIAKLTQLRSLGLGNSKVTDAGLVQLKPLVRLEWLYLDDTEVTDVGVEHLSGLKELKFLSLVGTQVTSKGVSSLPNSLPTLRIRTEK